MMLQKYEEETSITQQTEDKPMDELEDFNSMLRFTYSTCSNLFVFSFTKMVDIVSRMFSRFLLNNFRFQDVYEALQSCQRSAQPRGTHVSATSHPSTTNVQTNERLVHKVKHLETFRLSKSVHCHR